MIRSIEIPRFGGPEVFKLRESQPAPITSDGVRIQVHAAGVNFADLMMRMGSYPEAPPKPFVPGYEVAGVVTETGAHAKKFKPGDRVLAGTKFGGYTTELVLSEDQVWKTPAHLSDIEAAAIPVNFITAWVALEEMGRVREGDRVLIQSAAGGVGVAAVQIASKASAHVTGLVGSPSKAEIVRKLGAHEVLNASQDWGRDYDIVLDSTGGKTLKRCFQSLAPTGRVIHFGVSSMIHGKTRSIASSLKTLAQTPFFHPLQLMKENKGVFGLNVLQLFDPEKRKPLLRSMEKTLERFEKREFQVVIGKVFPLTEAGAAHSHLQSRSNIGKVVLDCRQSSI